ncbi:hypothetical protein E2C01_008092 [Portunus trituberculatus]|uniref:Uncharacterized protein n=1 Tax=Portunus trituberculatus TaxID=210409 RepID=A0A5B7D3Y0_PORTR|nr:hypothetical protein [Portunus trituberculatus]
MQYIKGDLLAYIRMCGAGLMESDEEDVATPVSDHKKLNFHYITLCLLSCFIFHILFF